MTRKELVILFQGVASLLLLYILFPSSWWKIAFFNYCFGFAYESSMHGMFNYHPDLVTGRCVRNTSINYLFPLGWNLIFALTMAAAGRMGGGFWGYILSALAAGNFMEITFHSLGYWTYNYDSTYMGLFKPFRPKIVVFGIPLQVFLGYSFVGLFVWCFEKHLFF